jgi:hypothetical protein
MIRFSLRCARDHAFDSWFQSGAAFDRLAAAGHVACPVCGGTQVEKALMAPAVVTDPTLPARVPTPQVPAGQVGAGSAAGPAPAGGAPSLRDPATDLERHLADLRARIERESEYVGLNFAAEARAIHDGAAPERPIWGEAKPDEARRLIEDGVPVAPLPFLPTRKAN